MSGSPAPQPPPDIDDDATNGDPSAAADADADAEAAAAAAAHVYASNGLEILQAASDAAQAIHNTQALHDAAVDVVEQHAQFDNGAQAHDEAEYAAVAAAAHLMTGQDAASRDPTINPKLTRLRRACDMCSMRKVKCDDTNIPCRPCRELGVDCTYNRETKRRGPPNKHAEAAKAAKRARLDTSVSAPGSFPPSPSPQTVAKTLVNISSDGVLDAETIAPMPVLELLVDDFFTYIHPLTPFPHEPTFRQSFVNREDRTRPEFLGLLASMVCALVASFPRSAREHLKTQNNVQLFPKPVVLIEKCRDIALLTRGNKWTLKQPKTLDDAATSYFLGMASGYVNQWNISRQFMAETLSLIRELGFSRPKVMGDLPSFGSDSYSNDALPFNNVKDQIGKRIFWCMLLAVRSFSQIGSSQSDLVIAPATPSLPYPAYPENVDDICILANEIIHQHEGAMTLLTGFRYGIDIYTTMNGVNSVELAYGMTTLRWTDQRNILRDGLLAAKSIVDNLPPELQLGAHSEDLSAFDAEGLQYVPPVWPNHQPAHDLRSTIKTQPQRRRQLQYEIQKVNIFVAQLATRAYFVNLYFDLHDVHLLDEHATNGGAAAEDNEEAKADADDDKVVHDFMAGERELIIDHLLNVLASSLTQRSLEPNSGTLIPKIQAIASSLLNDTPERKGALAIKSEDLLGRLVDLLGKLQAAGGPGDASSGGGVDEMAGAVNMMGAADEELEMAYWSEFRELQLRLAAQAGFDDGL